MTRGAERGRPRPPRRVVLLTESSGLAALVSHLLGGSGRLHRFASLRQALERDGLLDADTVVLDLPREGADTAVAHVRHHWKGELVVLAERGHASRDVAPQPAWTLLTRPFSAQALAAALGLPGMEEVERAGPAAQAPTQPEPARPAPVTATDVRAAAAEFKAAADVKAAARRAPSWAEAAWARAARERVAASPLAELFDRALRALAGFRETWQARRRVRVAGFSVFALLAFTVAFVLAAQGGRCGPGCDAFGTGFSPLPTIAPGASRGPATTAPRRPPVTTAAPAGGAPGTGEFAGASDGGRLATTTTERRAAATTSRPGSGGGTPRPTTPPTRPPTTQPPTTQPPTTQPPPTTAPTTTIAPTEPPVP